LQPERCGYLNFSSFPHYNTVSKGEGERQDPLKCQKNLIIRIDFISVGSGLEMGGDGVFTSPHFLLTGLLSSCKALGAWYVMPSGGGSTYGVGWGGGASDKPALGDYDGNGKTDTPVYRAGTGAWYVYTSGGGTPYGVGWGGDASDIPLTMSLSAIQ
jgi:hypothetical protein